MKTVIFVSVLFAAGCARSAPAENGTILQSFPGQSGPGYKPCPDSTGAVGPNHVVDFAAATFTVHDKTTGKAVKQVTMPDFWKSVQPANTLVLLKPNDPRMLFDTLSGRWFASCADDSQGHLYLAVSTSPDPTQPWRGILTPFKSPDFGFRMGVDKNGFYGCWWNFQHTKNDPRIMMDGCAVPIADMIAADGPNLSRATMFKDFELESFPATDLNPKKGLSEPAVFLNKQFPPDTKTGLITQLCLHKINWSSPTSAAMSPMQVISFREKYWGPSASGGNQGTQPSPGSPIRADEGRRTISVFAYGGRVLGCNGAKRTPESRPGILWYDVRVSDGVLLQEGLIDDPDCDYTHPSLAVDGSGNIGIGCTRTSAKEFPSVYIMMHAASDAPGTMRPAVKALAGTTYYRHEKYKLLPWGNYSATCVDPADSNRLWTYQQYANSENDGEWSTAWASFQLKP